MTQEITHITVIPGHTKSIVDNQRGDIVPMDSHWFLCCPGCGILSTLNFDRIIKNDDGTVSSTSPLHCHGSRMRQRYSIERNEVKWL